MRIRQSIAASALAFALMAPNALADECGAETANGQSGPFLSGAGTHVYALLSQYEEDGANGFERHNLFDLRADGSIAQIAAPFNGADVRAAALAGSGGRIAASWWTANGQQALSGPAGGPFATAAPVSPVAAEVSNGFPSGTEVAVADDGSGVIIDANRRVHRFTAAGVVGPAADAGHPVALAINNDGTAWFARDTADSKLQLFRWDAGAPGPVAVAVSLPFRVSYNLSAVPDGRGGVRVLSNARTGAAVVHISANGTIKGQRFSGANNAILRARGDGSFVLSTVIRSKRSGLQTLTLREGRADGVIGKPLRVIRGSRIQFDYDIAAQPGKSVLVTYAVNIGYGQLRVVRVKENRLGKPRAIKAASSRSGVDEPHIATTATGSAWVLFIAFDRRRQDSVCGKFVNHRYHAARISAKGVVAASKHVPGARPLYYYVGG